MSQKAKTQKETLLRCVNSFRSKTKSCSLILGEKRSSEQCSNMIQLRNKLNIQIIYDKF